jgi:L-threonylcarbamoyladenylate synthase
MTEGELARALAVLAEGRVVAIATETFFGLLADARRPDAIEHVFRLKGRDAAKGVALVLPDRAAWGALVTSIPPLAGALAGAFWPGPLTIALPAVPSVDARLVIDGTVAVRLPGPSDASRLTAAFGAPLTATSANLAGAPPARTDAEAAAPFADAIARGDLFVVSGQAPGGAPSTLVRVDRERVKILRDGQITRADLAAVVPAAALG